jgi:hypothetical protein
MTNAVLVHQLQTVGKRARNIDRDDIPNHEGGDRCGFGRFPGKHEAPHAIPLREDADDRSFLHDHD